MSCGSSPFKTSLIKVLPSTAPLPSSPRMYPSGEMFSTISFPLNKQLFDPVPSMQAMPSLCPHKALASHENVGCHFYFGFWENFCKAFLYEMFLVFCAACAVKEKSVYFCPFDLGHEIFCDGFIDYVNASHHRVNAFRFESLYASVAGNNYPIGFSRSAIYN